MDTSREGSPAPSIVQPDACETLPLIGILRASAEQTGGAFELIEYLGPATPPPHVHRDHDEAFYVLEGRLTFILGNDGAVAPQGALVLVPRGTRHGFTVEPGSRALLLPIPAGLAGFFRELGAGLGAGRSTADIRAELAGKYDSFPETG